MAEPGGFGGIDGELVARRARSFGSNAAAYADERPDYPEAAVRWALEPVSGRTSLRVLDLGAGTGRLTEGLVRLPVDVVAVEPDESMLAELRRRLPGVAALPGTAESIPLPDGSVDAILVGQAMHWFDLDRSIPEMARVLAPGGVLIGLWNVDDDRVPWVRGFKKSASSRVSFNQWRTAEVPLRGRHFSEVERADFAHSQRRTAASMVATVATHSHVLVLDEPERAAVLKNVSDYLTSTPETAEGEFDLPIVTVTIRAQRLD